MKQNKESNLFVFIRALLAGLMIGIAGTVYLMTDKSIIGVFLFSFALVTIIIQDFFLYTGKIGVINLKIKSVIWKIPFMILGNFFGTWIVANVLKLTKISDKLINSASILYQSKTEDSYLSLFILSIFCGLLMFLAVKNYISYSYEDNFSLIYIIMPVMIFIFCGFEHSIADMFYLNLSKNIYNFNLKDLLIILIILIGNGIGAKIIPVANKIKMKK